MTAQDTTTLKGYFSVGDRPTETQFANLIDSFPKVNSKGNATLDGDNYPSTGSPGVFVFPQTTNEDNPTGMPSNTAGVFAKNVTATTELFTIDEAGNVTQQTPHSWTLFDPDPSYEFPYVYRCENPHLGLIVEVDEWGIAREVERLTGKKFIHLAHTERLPWTSKKPMPQWLSERVNALPKAEMVFQLSWRQRLGKWCKRLPRWVNRVWQSWIMD